MKRRNPLIVFSEYDKKGRQRLLSILKNMEKSYPAVKRQYEKDKKLIEELNIDRTYRICHHSFKMYDRI